MSHIDCCKPGAHEDDLEGRELVRPLKVQRATAEDELLEDGKEEVSL